MSTATETSTDELIELFGLTGPEDADPCEMIRRSTGASCPNEAVFIVRWTAAGLGPQHDCRCRRVSKLCLGHGERAMQSRTDSTPIVCKVCDLLMVPTHIDRIRRG